MKSPAFQFYAQDFLVGVLDMTNEEVGVYIQLLAVQWTRGELEQDVKMLCRMVRARAEVVERILARKFVKTKQGWINLRLQKERDKQEKFCAGRRENAQKRWSEAGREKQVKKASPAVPVQKEGLNPVEQLYALYPRKIARPRALQAIKAALKKASFETIKSGLAAYNFGADPQFIPHPATWFNQERWEVEQTEVPIPQPYRPLQLAPEEDMPSPELRALYMANTNRS